MDQSAPVSPPGGDAGAVKARNRRNIWMGLGLLGFVILMGVGTAIRIQQGAGVTPCEGSLYWDMRSNSCVESQPEPVLGEGG